ncbi:mucin-17-like isoform X2 [Lytechinus variegatus]|uniref:mucin-17-like isoform X2 n=1 Tax=Lytechinus variegatus TaxID=7654 RepID=UPI001BB0E319|nr:mucin-17-like isoform X2 [Lytechinus variegatus]
MYPDMGVTYTILFFWLALSIQHIFCLSEFHGILTEEELMTYTKKTSVKEYDIISPRIHNAASVRKRSTDSTDHNEAHKVTFTAFDEEHHLTLTKNHWLLMPDLEVEYVQPDGSIRKEPVQSRDCHFFATSISHQGSTGALSTCGGVRGALSVKDEMLYIEPLKGSHTKRMKRSVGDDIQPHIIYKRSDSGDELFCPVGQSAAANGASSGDSGGSNGNVTTYTGPYLGAKFMEIYYVVDGLVYDEHGNETETYAMTVLNIMSRRFADPSLDISMRISVVRFLISTTTTLTAMDTAGSPTSVATSTDPEATLSNFCNWQASQSVDDDTNQNDWDLAILFTGHDLQRGGSSSSVGLAYVGTTCTLNAKCGINENIGFASGLVMAHETGHLLSLSHDGDPDYESCPTGRNIMSPSLSLSNGAFEWSSCSSEHMKIFLSQSSSQCLDDVPSFTLSPIDEYPGEIYDRDQQCQFAMKNPDALGCSSESCTVLFCMLPGESSCTSASQPAEGTPCGSGMWCINAECVNSTLNYTLPVDGGWSEYGNLSDCSRTCGTGVQIRSRTCTNPSPQWGGMPCIGDSHQYILCNEELCETSQDDFRNEQCSATNSIAVNGQLRTWTDYQEPSNCNLRCISRPLVDDRPGDFCDGTQCWYDDGNDVKSTNLCISGRCERFGCDGVLNSGLFYDDCLVCGGDGSSCNCTTGSVTTVMNIGEAVYVSIPIGSTSITADTYGSLQYIGLRVNEDFILGINTTNMNYLTSKGRYSIGNMVIDYDYEINIESHLQSLTEPSTEILDILVWAGSSSNPINFTYRYCTPAAIPPTPMNSMPATHSVSSTLMSTASDTPSFIMSSATSTSEASVSMSSMLATDSIVSSIPTGTLSDSSSFIMSSATPTSEASVSMTSMPATDSIVSSTPMGPASVSSLFTMSSATPTSEASVSMTSMPATDSIVSSTPMGPASDSSSFTMSSATPTSEASVSMTSMPATDSIVSSAPMGPASDSSSFTMLSATPTSEASVSMTSMPATDSIVSSTPMGPASYSSSFTMSSATPTSEASVSMTSMLATDSIVSSIPTGPASDSSSFTMSSATPTSEASVSMTSMPATDSIVSSAPMGPASDSSSFTMLSATPTSEASVSMTSMLATDSIVSSTPMGPASDSSSFIMSSATPTSEASVSMTSMPATDSIVSSTPMGPASDSSSFTMSSATPTSEASVSMTSMPATDSIVSSTPMGPASYSSSFTMSSATPTSEASVSMTSMLATDSIVSSIPTGPASDSSSFTMSSATPTSEASVSMTSMPATDSIVSSIPTGPASDSSSFIMSSATPTSEASVSITSMPATDSIVSSTPMGPASDSSSFIMSSATPTSKASVSMTSMPATDSIVTSTPMGPASDSSSFTMSSATPTSEASVSMTSMPATDSIVSSTPMGPASDSSSFTMSSATPTSEASVSMTSMLATDSIVSSIPTGPASDSSSFIMSSATPTSEASVSMTSMPATDSIVSSTPMGPASVSSFTMSSATPALESSVFMTMSVPVVTDSSAPATSAPATPTPTISSSDVSTMSSVTPTTPTDPCTLSPCQNGGTCSSNDGVYQCTCPDTHEGTNCETEIDPCTSSPCQNGATCLSNNGVYECTCPDIYSGTNCETEIDQCLSSPCQNGGTCSSSNGVYLCTCPDTHEGTNCETEKTTCDVVGCPSGETCTSESNVCECSGNTVRNNNGVCRAPQSAFTIQIVIVAFQTITDFQDVVNNQNSATSMEIRQSLTVILFTVYRRRYGTLFIGVIIRSFSLGSLEVEADLMFGEPENPTDTQQPPNNPMEIAEVFTNSLQSMDNTSTTGDFVVDSTRTTVTDTDECSNSTFNDCSQYADCTNTLGSFTCACLDGFQDTSPTEDLGRQCEDFNECSNPKICPEFATCMNSPGSFSCTCLPGFTGDGASCAPVDESGVLSDAELAGLVIGGVVIVFLVFIIIVTCFILIRRMMLRRTKSGKSINRLGPLNGGRGAGPFINGYYGDGYPLADYPSEMELGPINKPGYHNGAYYREPNEREGFSRPYMTAGENEQMPHY